MFQYSVINKGNVYRFVKYKKKIFTCYKFYQVGGVFLIGID